MAGDASWRSRPLLAAASADPLVFIKSGNVWLSRSDGSGAYGVTSGGN